MNTNPSPHSSSRIEHAGARALGFSLLWGAGLFSTPPLRAAETVLPDRRGMDGPAPASLGEAYASNTPDLGFPVLAAGSSGLPATPASPGVSSGVPNQPAGFPGATVDAIDPGAPYLIPGTELPPPEMGPLPLPPSEPVPAWDALPPEPASGTAAATSAKPPNQGDFWNNPAGSPATGGAFGGFGGRPSGFSKVPGTFPLGGGLTDSLRDGFSLSATLTGTYDTNPSMGFGPEVGTGAAEDSGQGDYSMTLGGSAGYQSKASPWTFGVNYSGSYTEYFSQSELSGYNQSAGGSVNYNSGPLSATFNLGIGFGSGANRYYQSVVDEISYSYGLSASYQYSSKTSLTGNFSQSLSSASGGSSADLGSFDLNGSALWRYSPLTQFGPGIRYTVDSGDTGQSRTSIGPTMTVNYKLSTKVSLNSQVGVDFAEYEDGQSADPSLSTSIALNYAASRLWGMNLSLNRDMQADPANAGGFSEITSLRVGYNRRIRRAGFNLGVSYETSTSQVPDSVTAGTAPNRDYLSFDTSLGMPIFADTCSASIFMRYSDESGSATDSFDSFQTGFSISRSF